MTDDPTRPGQVRASWGSHGVVRLDDGRQVDCRYRRAVGRPVCGDGVEVALFDDGSGRVERIHPRRSHFARADARGRPVIVAANLDQVVVVIAPRPAPSRDLLDRYLVAIEHLALDALVVVNKAELVPAATPVSEFVDHQRLETLAALGYPVLRTSCRGEPGLDDLPRHLAGRMSILVGQSGVGKSSLVQALLPDREIQVGALSRATGKGTHTTTTTTLYDLPDGAGQLLDSPGVWEFGIWKLAPPELAAGFREFRPWLGRCRFNDCRHDREPGCAVKAAVETGAITAGRYQAYRRLLAQATAT